MSKDIYYVVQIVKNNENQLAIDYPKDFPIPNVGDELLIVNFNGNEYSGIITKKRFVVRDGYNELTITLNCD